MLFFILFVSEMFSRFFTEFLNVYKDLKANNMILKRDQKGIFFFKKLNYIFYLSRLQYVLKEFLHTF